MKIIFTWSYSTRNWCKSQRRSSFHSFEIISKLIPPLVLKENIKFLGIFHFENRYYYFFGFGKKRVGRARRSIESFRCHDGYLNVDVKHGVTVSVVVFTFFNSEKVFATQTLLFVNKTELQWFFSFDVSLVGEFLTGLQIFGKRAKTNIILNRIQRIEDF